MVVRKIIRKIWFLLRYIYVQIFKGLYYEKKYLKGEKFKHMWSEGWNVAARDIRSRLFTGKNIEVKWPVSPNIECGTNIEFDIDDINNFWGSGNYFQTIDAKIIIGKGTWIAKNVGIITSNHCFDDLNKHNPGKDVIIGENCWIGMNSMILPGVVLGKHTIVGAGSVVTHSFKEGNCIIAGNPAKIIRNI